MFGIGGGAFPFAGGIHGSFAFVVAEVGEGEVSDAAEEPGARVDDFVPVCVEFEEGILDEVFRGFALADEAVGVAEQR